MTQPKDFNPKDKSKVSLNYFSQTRVALMREITRHPVLMAELVRLQDEGSNLQDPQDWGDFLAEIAAYCNVMMDGMYSQEDLEVLYPQLLKRLQDTRLSASSGIVLSS